MYTKYYKYADSGMGLAPKKSEAQREISTPKKEIKKLKNDDWLIIGLIAILLFYSDKKDIYLILALCYILAN